MLVLVLLFDLVREVAVVLLEVLLSLQFKVVVSLLELVDGGVLLQLGRE